MKPMILKTNILFGVKTIDTLPQNCSPFGKKFLILSTSKALIDNNVIKGFKREKLNVKIATDISSDPRSDEINDIVSSIKQDKIDAVIGIGGGSSIDTAKSIALLLGEKSNKIELYLENGKNPKNALPIIAVPTTSGTGSEVSAGAIITRNQDDLKIGIRNNVLIPSLAILDPNLTLSCPKKLTRDAGFDAFSHAFESYVSKNSNTVSEEISLNVIDIVFHNLPELLNNLNEITFRSKMMHASLLAGTNLLNVGTCLPHRIQYTFGIPVKITHGEGVAIVYRSWLKYLVPVKKLKRISKIFGCEETSESVINNVQNFMDKIGFKRDYGYLEEFPDFNMFNRRLRGNLENDPIYSPETIKKIYDEILKKN